MRHLILLSISGLLGLALLANCARISRDDSGVASGIIGGSPVSDESDLAPSVALIVMRVSNANRTMSLCTGTFISRDVLLTAAHCVPEQYDPESLRIQRVTRLGAGEFLRVKGYIRHAKYADSIPYKHDLALVRLDTVPDGVVPMNYEWTVQPRALSWDFLALGYGQSLPLTTTPEGDAGILRSVQLQAEFYEPTLFYFKVNTSLGKGICHGDSGGPALWKENDKYILVGVASYVEERDTGACNLSALYNNVFYYRTWIDENLKSLEAL